MTKSSSCPPIRTFPRDVDGCCRPLCQPSNHGVFRILSNFQKEKKLHEPVIYPCLWSPSHHALQDRCQRNNPPTCLAGPHQRQNVLPMAVCRAMIPCSVSLLSTTRANPVRDNINARARLAPCLFHTNGRRARIMTFSLWGTQSRSPDRSHAPHSHPWPQICVDCSHCPATLDGQPILYGSCDGRCEASSFEPGPRGTFATRIAGFWGASSSRSSNSAPCCSPRASAAPIRALFSAITPSTGHNRRPRATRHTALIHANENPPTLCRRPRSNPSHRLCSVCAS